jgi:hypothetical protein
MPDFIAISERRENFRVQVAVRVGKDSDFHGSISLSLKIGANRDANAGLFWL